MMFGSTLRFVSLWDMLVVNGSSFLESYAVLGKLGQFLTTILDLQRTQQSSAPQDFPKQAILCHTQHIADLLSRCEEVGLSTSVFALGQVISDFQRIEGAQDGEQAEPLLVRLLGSLNYTHNVIRDEMKTKFLFSLPADKVRLYAPQGPLFGQAVADRFPDASFDIQEAGRGMAMGMYTACVFHLMRAAEAAIAELAGMIDATVKNAHGFALPWGILVSNIKSKIDKMPKGESQDNWLKIHALLHSCNRAYRTKTAHPSAKYTEDEAEAALNATKSFMMEFCGLYS